MPSPVGSWIEGGFTVWRRPVHAGYVRFEVSQERSKMSLLQPSTTREPLWRTRLASTSYCGWRPWPGFVTSHECAFHEAWEGAVASKAHMFGNSLGDATEEGGREGLRVKPAVGLAGRSPWGAA